MNKLVSRVSAVLAVAALASSALAAPQGKTKTKVASAPKCPACKMELSTKKSAKNPTAVKINGKTYYCCDKCPMKAPAKKK